MVMIRQNRCWSTQLSKEMAIRSVFSRKMATDNSFSAVARTNSKPLPKLAVAQSKHPGMARARNNLSQKIRSKRVQCKMRTAWQKMQPTSLTMTLMTDKEFQLSWISRSPNSLKKVIPRLQRLMRPLKFMARARTLLPKKAVSIRSAVTALLASPGLISPQVERKLRIWTKE